MTAAIVVFADSRNIDVEHLAGAPEEPKHLWLITAKNCRVKSVARHTYQDARDAILNRYGSGKRCVSIP